LKIVGQNQPSDSRAGCGIVPNCENPASLRGWVYRPKFRRSSRLKIEYPSHSQPFADRKSPSQPKAADKETLVMTIVRTTFQDDRSKC
jgi:hypothetical protein